jgi:S-formylglutathione hydrolase FrmB
VLLMALAPLSPAKAGYRLRCKGDLQRVNSRLAGKVIDHSHNHGVDRRIWSAALNEKRDLYVYVPPGYDPGQCYPLMIWLHGFGQDEYAFLRDVVQHIDCAIVAGKLPPMIVAAPDGSLEGQRSLPSAGSFFLNSRAGAFEDYLMVDVWNFLMTCYPIRPEREAHVIAGVSMGGGAAYTIGIKYRERFKIVLGLLPPVNARWVDCHGRYFSDFDPCCWGWRTDFSRRCEVIARFHGIATIRMKHVTGPLYGFDPNTAFYVSQNNPIELIDSTCLREGELDMYIGYGGKDQFNIAAQVKSFLYRARERGLSVSVCYVPEGKHNMATALKIWPDARAWLSSHLAAYAPICGPDTAQ